MAPELQLDAGELPRDRGQWRGPGPRVPGPRSLRRRGLRVAARRRLVLLQGLRLAVERRARGEREARRAQRPVRAFEHPPDGSAHLDRWRAPWVPRDEDDRRYGPPRGHDLSL